MNRKEQYRSDFLLTMISVLTRKKIGQGVYPSIAWEEVGCAFQDPRLGALRERGIIAYTACNDGRTGFVLRRLYWDASTEELKAVRDRGKAKTEY